MDSDNRIRYLESIQRIIDRLSNCSFLLKGWAVTLVAALIALSAKDSNTDFAIIAYIPVVCFWLLDSYYLMMERQFRRVYRKNADLHLPLNDFSIRRGRFKLSLYLGSLFSITQLLIYVPLVASVIIIPLLL